MKVDYAQLEKVMEYLRYNVGVKETSYMEISENNEDVHNGVMCSSLTISLTTTKAASTYDSIKTTKTIEVTVEIFSSDEKRSPRVSVRETRNMFED